jgi:hypothetical protein
MRRRYSRLVWVTAALVSALVLLVPGGTQARWFATAKVTTASFVSAGYSMTTTSGATTGISPGTVVVDPTTGFGYAPVDLALKNTGGNPIGVTVDTATSASGSTGTTSADTTSFAARLGVVWVSVPSTTTDCSTVGYTTNVVWSATAVSGTGTPVVGTAGATLAGSGATTLCARYQLGSGSGNWGATITVTYGFLGWNAGTASFLTNAVSWKHTVQLKVPAPTADSPACSYSSPTVTFKWVWSPSGNPSNFSITGSGTATPAGTARSQAFTLPNFLGVAGSGTYDFALTAVGSGTSSTALNYRVVIGGLGSLTSCTATAA